MIKPLLRVIPTYSGNVKISCVLSDYVKSDVLEYDKDAADTYDCYVRGATISPLSKTIYDKQIQANLLSSDYSFDLKKFYIYYSDVFYKNGMSFSQTDVPQVDELNPIYDRNVDMEYGCSRVSYQKYGHQLEFFAPIYVDDPSDLPQAFYIVVNIKSSYKDVTKKIRVNIMRNSSDKRNYLCHYLDSYKKYLDESFIYMSASNKNGNIYGIDLTHGGQTSIIDSTIGNLLTSLNPINAFDYCIGSSWQRNKMAMKQVLPLSFVFDLDGVMDSAQSHLYKGSTVTISGHYVDNDGNEMSMYDWSCDYDNLSEKILVMNTDTGVMQWKSGKVSNLMDDNYPSLHEARILNYAYSSKISKMYSRWKLRASDDDNPYITNLSFAFSRNQDSSVVYGLFPQKTYSISAIATAISNTDSIASDYSLIFPLGSTKENYDDKEYISIIDKYEDEMNNYGFNWFEVVSDESRVIEEGKWKDIKNDECYYNGILHKFSSIYSKIDSTKEKLDKFGVFVWSCPTIVVGKEASNLSRVNYTIKTSIHDLMSTNAKANKNIVNDMVGLTSKESKALCEAFTSVSPSDYEKNSEVSVNESFVKLVDDDAPLSYFTYSTSEVSGTYSYTVLHSYIDQTYSPRYINPKDLGFTIGDIDDWYDYSDVQEALSTASELVSKKEAISRWCEMHEEYSSYTSYDYEDHISLALSRIMSQEGLWNLAKEETIEMSKKYITYSYELLPIHDASIMLTSYTITNEDGEEEKQWSYMKIGGKLSYVAYNYGIKVHTSSVYSPTSIDNYSDPYVVDGNNKRLCFAPGYVAGGNSYALTLDKMHTYLLLNPTIKDRDSDLKVSDVVYGYEIEDKDKIYRYYWSQFVNYETYKDPFLNQIYISSKEDGTPHQTTGFTYCKVNGIPCAYTYIVFAPQNLISYNYGFNIYRKSSFFNNKWIKQYEVTDVDSIVRKDIQDMSAQGISGTKGAYNLNDFDANLKDSPSWLYKKSSEVVHSMFLDILKENLKGKPRYMFMPVMFGNSSVYATNVFVKKDDTMQFGGNKMKTSEVENDDDMIWVDTYNFRRLMLKYGLDYDEKMKLMKTKKTKLLSKDHLYWWFNELCKNYDYIYPEWINEWYDHVFVRTKRFVTGKDGKLGLADYYVKLSTLDAMQSNMIDGVEKNELRFFNFFYDRMEVDENTGLWRFRKSEKDDYGGKEIELMIEIDCVRLDDEIMEKVMRLDDDSSEYRDIYLYRIEKEDEWERRMLLSSTPRIDYSSTDIEGSTEEPVGHSLTPLFNNIYCQNRSETEIYAHYLLNDISCIDIVDDKKGKKYYRYNSNDIDWMIEMTDETVDVLSQEYGAPKMIDNDESKLWQPTLIEWLLDKELSVPFKNSLSKLLYYKYDGSTIGIVSERDDLGYGIKNFNTIIEEHEDGTHTNYGFWLFKSEFDNTTNSMNIIPQYDISTTPGKHDYRYDSKIKWLKYINGHDISDKTYGKRYMTSLYKQIVPFLKTQPYDIFNLMTTVVYQDKVVQKMRFDQTLDMIALNKENQPSELTMTIKDKNTYVEFQRYFDSLAPIITKSSYVRDQWVLKFKDVKDSTNTIVSTGKYPSIGDATIWKSGLSISSRNSVPVYVPSTDPSIKDYNNRKKTDGTEVRLSTLEQKHFNDSVVVYCDTSLEMKLSTLHTIEEIDDLQSYDEILKVFKKLTKGTQVDNMTETQLLFLFNRYESKVTCEPVRLNSSKTSKLYRVRYKFLLK